MARKTKKHLTLSEHLALRAQAAEESRAKEEARLHTIQRLKEWDAQVQCMCQAAADAGEVVEVAARKPSRAGRTRPCPSRHTRAASRSCAQPPAPRPMRAPLAGWRLGWRRRGPAV